MSRPCSQYQSLSFDLRPNHRPHVYPGHRLSAGLGFTSFGWVSTLVSITIFGVAARQIALMSIYFAGNTRLPMVAGWDNLLPAWFAKLHKRYRTPVNSILFVAATTLAFSLASLVGVKEQ